MGYWEEREIVMNRFLKRFWRTHKRGERCPHGIKCPQLKTLNKGMKRIDVKYMMVEE